MARSALWWPFAIAVTVLGTPPFGQAKEKKPAAPEPVFRIGADRPMHGEAVRGMAFSSDGKLLASVSTAGPIRIWEVQSGKEIITLKTSTFRMAFRPTGGDKPRVLMTASIIKDDRFINFWDVATGKQLPQTIKHPGTIFEIAISPDGKHIVSTCPYLKQVFVWDADTGKEVKRWDAHAEGAAAIAFSVDGKTLASARTPVQKAGKFVAADTDIALWDFDTGKLIKHLRGHPFMLQKLVFSADGKSLVGIGTQEGPVWWNTETGEMKVKKGRYSSSGIAANGKTMALVEGSKIQFVDLKTGDAQKILDPKHDLASFVPLALSANGEILATPDGDGRIELWDVAKQKLILPEGALQYPIAAVTYSRDGKFILTAGRDSLVLWDAASGKKTRTLDAPSNFHVGERGFARIMADNRTFALGNKGSIRFWNLDDGKFLRTTNWSHGRADIVSLASDGAHFVTAGYAAKEIKVWESSTGTNILSVPSPGRDHYVPGGYVSSNGEYLLAYGPDDLHVHDMETGKSIYQKIKKGPGLTFLPQAMGTAFSPGSIVTAHWEITRDKATLILFETATGTQIYKDRVTAHTTKQRIAFSPNGLLLALVETAGRNDGLSTVRVQEVATGKQIMEFTPHRARITSMAFSPDSKSLVTASQDCTALAWNVGALTAEQKKVDVSACWAELAGADRLAAYVAFCRLRLTPDETIPFLKKELAKQAPAAELEKTRRAWAIRLLEDLNTPSAQAVLQSLAESTPEAEAAIKRLKRKDSQIRKS